MRRNSRISRDWAPQDEAAPSGDDAISHVRSGLHRLIYVSEACSPEGRPAAETVDRIARESHVRNRRDKVTGLLVEVCGHFVQFLEGEADMIEATFERICHDTRHSKVSILDFAPVPAREFEGWSMRPLRAESMARSSDLEDLFLAIRRGIPRGALVRGLLDILDTEAQAQARAATPSG